MWYIIISVRLSRLLQNLYALTMCMIRNDISLIEPRSKSFNFHSDIHPRVEMLNKTIFKEGIIKWNYLFFEKEKLKLIDFVSTKFFEAKICSIAEFKFASVAMIIFENINRCPSAIGSKRSAISVALVARLMPRETRRMLTPVVSELKNEIC